MSYTVVLTPAAIGRQGWNLDAVMRDAAEVLRVAIARKRDRLVARQRRGYSAARQRIIDELGAQYRAVRPMAGDP